MDAGILDSVTNEFSVALIKDSLFLQQTAYSIFKYLAIIQLATTSLWLSLTGESAQKAAIEIIKSCIFFAVFYALIDLGGNWLPDIFNSFMEIGNQANTNIAVNPSSIIDQGYQIVGSIYYSLASVGLLRHPFVSALAVMICIIIMIIYAFIAAELTILIVKSYVLVATSSFFFACGANQHSRDLAVNFMRAVIALGVRLMITYLILSVGQNLGYEWADLTKKAAENGEAMSMLLILATVIVYFSIFKNIPSFMSNLVAPGLSGDYASGAMSTVMNAKYMTKGSMKAAVNTLKGAKNLAQALRKISPPNFRRK